MTQKLDAGQKNILRLTAKGADQNGWAPVSKQVFPIVEALPRELVEIEKGVGTSFGRVRLTALGTIIVTAMEWL